MAKVSEKRVTSLGEKVRDLMDSLDHLACPICSQRGTLTIEHVRRSGIRVTCEGYNPHGEDGDCPFQQYHLITSNDELPKIETTE